MLGKRPTIRLARARDLRANMTDAERALWNALKSKQLSGYKFSRQIIVGPYIADFVCRTHKLIIELDGGQHGMDNAIVYDEARTEFMQQSGFQVMRFWNYDVLSNLNGVLEMILTRLGEIISAK
jgi:very-short-patch-repair endonuclease